MYRTVLHNTIVYHTIGPKWLRTRSTTTLELIWATCNLMDSRAILRADIGFYIGTELGALLNSLYTSRVRTSAWVARRLPQVPFCQGPMQRPDMSHTLSRGSNKRREMPGFTAPVVGTAPNYLRLNPEKDSSCQLMPIFTVQASTIADVTVPYS